MLDTSKYSYSKLTQDFEIETFDCGVNSLNHIDWCSFRESEIVAFNQGQKEKESTIRLANDDTYRIALSYQELKKIIISK